MREILSWLARGLLLDIVTKAREKSRHRRASSREKLARIKEEDELSLLLFEVSSDLRVGGATSFNPEPVICIGDRVPEEMLLG